MPLPIVLGGKSLSAQTLPGACGRPYEAEDGRTLCPFNLYQTLSWGVCPKGEWLVRVTCSYYDMLDSENGKRDCTMVEVRIQISPMTRPLSSDYRETAHHLKLVDGAPGDYAHSQTQVEVSWDRRNLAVLLFHPHQQSSACVIFQLRKPRPDLSNATKNANSANPIPLPSYIQKVGNDDSTTTSLTSRDPPAVATHPRFVSVWGISTICRLPNVHPPIFLAACQDGSMVWLDARSGMGVAMGVLKDMLPETHMLPFSHMTAAPCAAMDRGQLLIVTGNGKCLLTKWQVESSTKVQQTFLKRASTGTVVMQSRLEDSPEEQLKMLTLQQQQNKQQSIVLELVRERKQQKEKDRRLPDNTKSTEGNFPTAMHEFFSIKETSSGDSVRSGRSLQSESGLASLAQKMWGLGSPQNIENSSQSSKGSSLSLLSSMSSTTARKTRSTYIRSPPGGRQQSMDSFVLNHLQTQAKMRTSSNVLQRQQQIQQGTVQKGIRERLRRRSALPKQGLNEDAALDTLRRNMNFEVLATLGDEGPHRGKQGRMEGKVKSKEGGGKARGVVERGSVVDAKFSVLSTIVCVLYAPSDSKQAVAEIFSISETGSMQAMLPLTLDREQMEQAFNMHPPCGSGEKGSSTIPFSTSLQSRFGLDYDALSDTFAISTTYSGIDRWIGCLWNWRSNVLGWTIHYSGSSSSLWSRLYFARHQLHGNHLVFLESQMKEKYISTRKHGVAIGLLSPSSSRDGASLEPNSLLLSSDSVRFADVYQRSGSELSELEWKIATLPLNYRNAYGPPSIATSGRQNGGCIAVASMNGVCILDRFYKWKQFGTPAEEKSFQVLAMTWWEGFRTNTRWQYSTEGEELSQDLLVAVIQSNNGRQYLSCWSPKRLDLAHQLLETPDYKPVKLEDGSIRWSWGVPLAKDVKLTSISLLAEPLDAKVNKPRRAVVMVSSTNAETCEMNYSCYRLQVSNRLDVLQADTYHELKPYVVLVEKSISGVLKNGMRSVSPISFAFLAAANFDFDLSTEKAESVAATSQEIVTTMGVVRSPGGIEAISFSGDGKVFIASVIEKEEVAQVRLADVICNSNCDASDDDGKRERVDSFIWTINLLNGHIYCWNVPYRIVGEVDERQMALLPKKDGNRHRPDGLNLPAIVCRKESRETRHRYFLGTYCHVGSSTDWMQQSSSGTQTDISLGLVPESEFGCVLRAGQHVRRLHRRGGGGDFDSDLFASDFLESELYGPSEFLMMPPVFVSSIYMLLLEAAYLGLELPLEGDGTSSEHQVTKRRRLQKIGNHISRRLLSNRNSDAVMMALRLLILRAIELLSSVDKKHRNVESTDSKSNLMLAMSLFSEIVDVVRRCTTNLQFAAFFLEVGRQIEPSCLAHLFPLPQSRDIPTEEGNYTYRQSVLLVDEVDRFTARSVVDLFSLCIHEGSLAASASALPLLDSRIQSRNYCDLLLMRAIESFVRNTDSREAQFDCTQEERRVIGDIFRFGIKLEDAALLEHKMLGKDSEVDGLVEELGFLREETITPRIDSVSSAGSNDLNVRSNHRSLVCVGGGRKSSILNYVIPTIFDERNAEEEEAIRRAASSFIEGKANLASMDFLNLAFHEDSESDRDNDENGFADEYLLQSVAGLVGGTLLDLLRTPKIDQPWATMAALARLLLQQFNPMPDIEVYGAAVDCTDKAILEEILPCQYIEKDNDKPDPISRFLVKSLYRCGNQIKYVEAALLVDLVLLLLQRMGDFPLPSEQQSEVTASLVLIGLVAGHHSGRADDLLLTAGENSYVVQIFQDAKSYDVN